MRTLRLLLTGRWLTFLAVVLALSYLAWWLGEWQFGRLEDRRGRNAVIEQNYDADPVPVDQVLALGEPVSAGEEWQRIRATGSYLPEQTIVVRYRTREGSAGVQVVVPLRTDAGPVLLIDRGWLSVPNNASDPDNVPAPPSGTVTVTGWVRADATGDATLVRDGSTRAISSRAIAAALDLPVYGGFVALDAEDPGVDNDLLPTERPETGSGPHFFYGLQWWFFGALAIGGFCYLLWDEVRHGRRDSRPRRRRATQRPGSNPPSTGNMTPDRYDDAGESTKAATRPNSSGSP